MLKVTINLAALFAFYWFLLKDWDATGLEIIGAIILFEAVVALFTLPFLKWRGHSDTAGGPR